MHLDQEAGQNISLTTVFCVYAVMMSTYQTSNSYFPRMMTSSLMNMQWKPLVCLDDIFVITKTTFVDHPIMPGEILQRFVDAGMWANATERKCCTIALEFFFLGSL